MRFDDERVVLPSADRVAHEARMRIARQLSTVEKNLPMAQVLVEDGNDHRRLDDPGPAACAQQRARTLGQTLERRWIVLAEILHPLLVECVRPRLNFRWLQIGKHIAAVGTGIHSPEAGEIRLPIRGARSWRREIGLSVSGARHASRGFFQPLRREWGADRPDNDQRRKRASHRSSPASGWGGTAMPQ